MENDELFNLWNSVNGISEKLTTAIIEETQDDPLILLNEDDDTEGAELYDLPWGCIYGKYDSYMEGVVKSVNGNHVRLFMTGEYFGEVFDMETSDLDFESRVEILSYLVTRRNSI